MTELIDATAADQALKARHRAMWALGDYPAVAHEIDRETKIVPAVLGGEMSERTAGEEQPVGGGRASLT